MIKLLHFSGPCSFATFLASAGDAVLPAIKLVRSFEYGGVVCFIAFEPHDAALRAAIGNAIQTAHAVEPVRIDYETVMSSVVMGFLCGWLTDRPRASDGAKLL
jgi:hypothetical protein